MNRLLKHRIYRSVAVAALCITAAQVRAVDINVPGDFATIQAAEAAAAAGDRILVAAGTYNTPAAGLVIDVANLQLLSTGAVTIQNNTADSPVIVINAPGVIIGDTGQGFTIKQQTPGPGTVAEIGESCIVIQGDQVKFANPVRVQFNTLQGNDTPEGILVKNFIEAGGLIIQNNTFEQMGGTFAFVKAMFFTDEDHPSTNIGDVSIKDANVDILNNTATKINDNAIDIDGLVYNSTVNVVGNSFTGVSSIDVVDLDDGLDVFSTMNFTNNTFDAADDGLDIAFVRGFSNLNVTNLTVTNFTSAAIDLDDLHDASNLLVENCTFAGNATAGIDVDSIEDASTATIRDNNISGFTGRGITLDTVYYGSNASITGNTLLTSTQGDYGIYTDTEYASHTVITGNRVTGWELYGIRENSLYALCSIIIDGNTLIGDAAGGDTGIYVEGPSYQGTAQVTNNTVQDFDQEGIEVYDIYYNCSATVTGNTLTGLAAGATYGIYNEYTDYTATLLCNNNTISNISSYGIYNNDIYYKCSVEINNNTISGIAAGMSDGIYSYGPYDGDCHLTVNNNNITDWTSDGIYVEYVGEDSTCQVNSNTVAALAAGGSYGIYVYETYDGGDTQVQDNNVTDFDTAGIYLEYIDDYGGHAVVNNNILTAHSSGADYGIYNYDLVYGSTLVVTGNTATGYGNQGGNEAGFWNDNDVDSGSDLTLSNNTFTPHAMGSEYGIYIDDGFDYGCIAVITNNTVTGFTGDGLYSYYCEDGSDLTLVGNTFTAHSTGCDNGVYLDDGFDYGSPGNISNNTITGFTETGIWIYELDDGSIVSVNTNTLEGHTDGADFGVYVDDGTDYGSFFEVVGNIISNIQGQPAGNTAGIYYDILDDGSEAVICNNFIRALPGEVGNYMAGIYCYDPADYGSHLTICDNDIAGFEDAQIFFNDDVENGSTVLIQGNRLAGGHYGIRGEGYGLYTGSDMTIEKNIISNFSDDGISYEIIDESRLSILQNRIDGNGSANGIKLTDIIASSEVLCNSNCILDVADAFEVNKVEDSAFVEAHQNDVSGSTLGFRNLTGLAANTVQADNNFFGAATRKSGEVNTDPELAAAPDEDGDGVVNCDDGCPDSAAGAVVDASGCACDQLDPTDTDGDGTADCNDGCPNDAAKSAAGACGCGVADTDTDGDGTADCTDACDNDPSKIAAGSCGCGNPETDNDGDGTPNCVDDTPDGEIPCGLCGPGAAGMMPLAILGMVMMRRGRWTRNRKGTGVSMNRNVLIAVATFAALGFGAASARAVDINVPADQPTIQDAINAANPGDRVLVAPNTYTTPANGIEIDVANLQLLSTGGAGVTILENNTVDMPVVLINAPGVILGDVDQGFTIRQKTVGPASVPHIGESCVFIKGDQVKFGNPTRVQFNVLAGNETDEGILVNPYVEAGGLIVQNNTFQLWDGSFSFKDAFHIHFAVHPNLGSVSMVDAGFDFLNNTGTEINRAMAYFHDDVVKCVMNFSGNDFRGTTNGEYGLYFADDIQTFSTVEISNELYEDFDYGVYVNGELEGQTVCNMRSCTVEQFRTYGAYIYSENGSSLLIDSCTLISDGNGDYGIYTNVDYGSTGVYNNNTITNFDNYGIYVSNNEDGSTCTITNNTMTSNEDPDYGIDISTDYGSTTLIQGNLIQGFDYAGVYEDYPEDGSVTTIDSNRLIADGDGADYGVYISSVDYGAHVIITNNIAQDFLDYGIYISYPEYASTASVGSNTLMGHPDGAEYGIYVDNVSYGATATVLNNTITNVYYCGIYNDDIYYGSSLQINGNTIQGYSAGTEYGVYSYGPYEGDCFLSVDDNTITEWYEYGIYVEYVGEDSACTINRNTVTAYSAGGTYGIYLYEAYDAGTCAIDANTVSNFDEYGIYVEYVDDYGGHASVTNNIVTAHPDGAYAGIYNYVVEYGSSLEVIGNTCTGHGNKGGDEAGFWQDDYTEYGALLVVTNNTFEGHPNGTQYGFYSDESVYDGSECIVMNNTFTNFTDTGLWNYYVYDGSIMTVVNNTLTAHPDGADYGMWFDDGLEYGSTANISNNTVTGFMDTGIYLYDNYEGCRLSINSNTLEPHADGAYFGINLDDLYMSMSLDGFVAGPNERPDNGLGDGGERLHEWVFLGNDAEPQALRGNVPGVNGQIVNEFMTTGAVVAGRGTFEPAGGWGGDHHDGVPIYIVYRSEPGIDITRWPLVHRVPGVETAMAEAKRAAGDKNVLVHGAKITQLALAAGVLDELELSVIPVLFGDGRRLFDNLAAQQVELERTRVLQGEGGVTHMHYRVRR